jgi:hypothetical protein
MKPAQPVAPYPTGGPLAYLVRVGKGWACLEGRSADGGEGSATPPRGPGALAGALRPGPAAARMHPRREFWVYSPWRAL